MNVVWLVLGLIGAVVIYLIVSGEGATTFGIQNTEFAQIALLSMWGALIASAVIPRRGQFKQFARNMAIWVMIVLALMAGYVFRYDLQNLGSRLTAGLIPGSPRAVESIEGRERVVLAKGNDNHFVARMQLNGRPVTLLVDTGASSIVLTAEDAELVGIDVSALKFTIPTSTANGTAFAARAKLGFVEIGPIERRNLTVMVSKPGVLSHSLLGMNFLSTLTAFEFRGDELFLTD